jgi:hypothetical protein
MNRRDMLTLSTAGAISALAPAAAFAEELLPSSPPPQNAFQYDIFELTIEGPSTGNPYVDQHIAATFTLNSRSIAVEGFYDGGTTYKVRFMPETPGNWSYTVTSSFAARPTTGTFTCQPARPGVHGPVRVANLHHFAHADGTPYFPFGTTCYAWTHQGDALELQTLASLKAGPFNKIRMCIFPKSYQYNRAEPVFYAFQRPAGTPLTAPGDITRFDPAFWAHLEERIAQLRDLNIQADLILFHPYDRWGFASMPPEADERYLRYLIARLSAYSNVWWSLANEFDLMKSKTTADFTRLLHLTQQYDPYQHLRSIHYSKYMYDYASPAVTHASLQTYAFEKAAEWLDAWRKPVIFDEAQYEGNINSRWGNLSGEEMTHRFWRGVVAGCYVTHGETFIPAPNTTPEDIIWWSKGGILHGTSPARIGFLRHLLETNVAPGLEASASPYYLNATTKDTVLYYFDFHSPGEYEFPLPEGSFRAELVDPWAMTTSPLPGAFTGKPKIALPAKPYQAILFLRNATSG